MWRVIGEGARVYRSGEFLKVITDLHGNILSADLNTLLVTGYSSGEIVGLNVRVLRPVSSTSSAYYDELWDTIRSGRVWSGVLGMRGKDGIDYWSKGTIYTIYDMDGDPVAYCSKRLLCTQREEEEHLAHIKSIS